jgi:hypothetical protein
VPLGNVGEGSSAKDSPVVRYQAKLLQDCNNNLHLKEHPLASTVPSGNVGEESAEVSQKEEYQALAFSIDDLKVLESKV